MHSLPIQVYRQTVFKPTRVVVSRLHDTIARFHAGVKSLPGTRTGVNSHQGDSHRHDILWWYHVNKYIAMKGNRVNSLRGESRPSIM